MERIHTKDETRVTAARGADFPLRHGAEPSGDSYSSPAVAFPLMRTASAGLYTKPACGLRLRDAGRRKGHAAFAHSGGREFFVASSRVLPSAGSQHEGPPGRPPRGGSPGLESQAESGSRANRPPAPWSISPWRRTRPLPPPVCPFPAGGGDFFAPQENSTTNWMKSF